ncbi:hypothetical protein BDP27DRAFT_1363869 [Rhodocollybia butyracea]|uniref:Nephrocystin 3-like N-terminal domain-containing protein n=1 Tax=Rhodocollybia butyracea TaxID=206335 RepID=A0A9P5PSY2_9AGAR|nr:hypothetical protein BDP27DRAFT_1363869 [Rhodocollybia butyracea]
MIGEGNNGYMSLSSYERMFTGAHNFSISGPSQFTVNNYPMTNTSPRNDMRQKLQRELNFVALNAGIDGDKICLPGTRGEIIREITNWVQYENDNTVRRYILCGEAGTGKSAIAHTVGKKLQEMGFLVAFFAFNRSMLENRTPSNALRTIAYTIGVSDQNFAEGLLKVFGEDPSLSGSTSIQTQWEKLIVAPAQRVDLAKHDPDGPRDQLLSVLMSGRNDLPSNFRVFTTSRLENDIIVYVEKSINWHASPRIRMMRDIEGIEEDIYRFVVAKMQTGGGLGILVHSQCRLLATKAEGYFQWASTVCKALRGGGKGGLSVQARFQQFMDTAPGNYTDLTPLDSLYMSILAECFDQEAMERYHSVMAIILAVFEPLSRTSLKKIQIIGFPEESDTIDAVVCFLGSLFTGVESLDTPISPVHTSIRDFLVDETRSRKFAVNIGQGHTMLVWGSLQLMMKNLHFNMCALENSYVFNSDVKDMNARIAKTIPQELQYACLFWDEHLCQSAATEDLLILVEKFWYKSSLFWLEVMSIFQTIHVVSRAIENVRKVKIEVPDKVSDCLMLRISFP